jgi:hypothetical protein
MKKLSFLLALPLLATMAACTKTSKKSSNNGSSTSPVSDYCRQYPQAFGCSGTSTGTTSGSTTGTTTGFTTGGSTTGSTTGGTYTPLPTSDNNWTDLYAGGVPSGSCSTPTGSGYEPRKGTVTISGAASYFPDNAWTSVGESQYTSARYSHNNSYYLVNVPDARDFLDTDAILKIRFKVRPQPKAPAGKSWCFNRLTGTNADSYGYRNLKFKAALRRVNADGTLDYAYRGVKEFTAGVNSCTAAEDYSQFNQGAPYGSVLVIYDVYSDQGCSAASGCTSYTKVRDASCWSVDIEAQVDGTKSI